MAVYWVSLGLMRVRSRARRTCAPNSMNIAHLLLREGGGGNGRKVTGERKEGGERESGEGRAERGEGKQGTAGKNSSV